MRRQHVLGGQPRSKAELVVGTHHSLSRSDSKLAEICFVVHLNAHQNFHQLPVTFWQGRFHSVFLVVSTRFQFLESKL